LYRYLTYHCVHYPVRHYLEIGTRDGDSLRVVLENTSGLQSVWVADLWGTDYGGSGRGNHQHIDQLLDDFNFDGLRAFLDGNSQDTIPALMPEKAAAFDCERVAAGKAWRCSRVPRHNSPGSLGLAAVL
jgi:hypothetical protein